MDPEQEAVIHDPIRDQHFHVPLELLHKELTLHGTKNDFALETQPIHVLHDGVRIAPDRRVGQRSSNRRALFFFLSTFCYPSSVFWRKYTLRS